MGVQRAQIPPVIAARPARPSRAGVEPRRPGCQRRGLAAPLGSWAGRQARRGLQRRPLQRW